MKSIPVILIFDVGKTNKKVLLYNEAYEVVWEQSRQFPEIRDEEGFPCEDLGGLAQWVLSSVEDLMVQTAWDIRAIHFATYGASFVYLDKLGKPLLPLYNYLKPFPVALQQKYYATYGGETAVSRQTASPVLGSLNSGLQLYRIKYEKPEAWESLELALHLPQFLSFLIGDCRSTDITSIGCHTGLWDFQQAAYHKWVLAEGLQHKFAPIQSCTKPCGKFAGRIPVGVGMHDSSAALIPYLFSFREPFILLSTGTWCISLNPFNHKVLSDYELQHDCLTYLSFEGKPVKASRLFAGYEHEQQVARLNAYFHKEPAYYTTVRPNPEWIERMGQRVELSTGGDLRKKAMLGESAFAERGLESFTSFDEAYHQFISDIIRQQQWSTNLVMKGTSAKRIFVDGGFSRNPVYMQFLAEVFPDNEVYAATVPQASAMGAALALHESWNTQPLPTGLIHLKYYSSLMSDRNR